MSIARTLPYLRASEDRCRASDWYVGDVTTGRLLGEHVPGWDSNTDLLFSRHIAVDVRGLRDDCGLPPDAPLRLVVRWHASTTHAKGVCIVGDLESDGVQELEARLALAGPELGGSLELLTAVVLARALPPAPIRAHLPGTVLWDSSKEVRLQGGGSRFPMEAVTFSTSGHRLPTGAAWHLELDPEALELPVLGAVMLFLNLEHPPVAAMIDDPEAPASKALAGMLRFDVASRLVRAALSSTAYAEREEAWPRDSLGRVMHRLFKLRFRRDSLDALRQQMVEEPLTFASLLQARLGLMESER